MKTCDLVCKRAHIAREHGSDFVTAENLMMTDEFFDIERIFFSQFVKDGSGWIEILANSSLFRTFPSLEVRVPRILKGFFFASMRFLGKSQISRIHACEFLSNILSTEIHRIVCILIFFLICRQTLSYELLVTM